MKKRMILATLIAAAALPLVWPASASAQNCGTWQAPVLCQGELRMRTDNWQGERLDTGRTLALGLDTSIEIEIQGRDQFGRTFPAYRLALDFDDRECDRILDVQSLGEGRLRLSTNHDEGRCRLDIWVPGNLNFEWRLEVEIAKPARVGYERGEAETVARGLYLALLTREPDPAGLSGAVMEIQRGNLQAQVTAMIRSSEFQTNNLTKDSATLLEQFYRGLLGRSTDSAGIRTFLDDMQRRRYLDVVLGIIRAPEYEEMLARGRAKPGRHLQQAPTSR